MGVATYQPRAAEGTVLHRVVRENLETFLREAGDRTDDGGLPRFVEREFREFLTYQRVQRLLARRGLDVDDPPDVDPLAEESPALAGISSASIQGRIALGPRAGARVLQLGREPDAPWVTSRGPCQAHLSRASDLFPDTPA